MSAGRRFAAAALLAAPLLLLGTGGALAANPTCTISVTPLAFGVYVPFSGAGLMSTGSIRYSCPSAASVSIIMDGGNSGSVANRILRNGAHPLSYNIYLDAGGTQIWGDGTGGSQYYINNQPQIAVNFTIPFYGRIPGSQTGAVVGAYSDTILVTIRF